MSQQVEFRRDCEAVVIPAGNPVRIPKGTEAVVTQSLGGTFTLQIPNTGALVRVAGTDADAIGLEPPPPDETPAAPAGGDVETQVWEALKGCYDPEIPVNIVDLGLVYDLKVDEASGGHRVAVKMTLTAQGCGMGTVIAGDAQQRIAALPGVAEATVDIVWDPPWGPQMITPEGREKLGIN